MVDEISQIFQKIESVIIKQKSTIFINLSRVVLHCSICLYLSTHLSKFTHALINCFILLVKLNQIWIRITLFRLIWHQTKFRLMLNQSHKLNYNQNSVKFDKVQIFNENQRRKNIVSKCTIPRRL